MPPSATIGAPDASRSRKRLTRVVDGAAFDPARDGHELACHVATVVRGQDDDGPRHVLRDGDLAQRHRA